MLKNLRRVHGDVGGLAAMEFALVLPVLFAILLAVIEFSHFSTVDRRANFAAHFFAEYLSRDPDDTLSNGERIQAQEAWGIMNPHINPPDDNPGGAGARTHAYGYASVEFVKVDPSCTGNSCARTADVHWTFYGGSYRGIQGVRTSCNLNIVANSVDQNGSNVPEGMVGRGAIIMTDTTFRYEPLLLNGFIGTTEKTINVIRKTRTGSKLEYNVPSLEGTGHVQRCP